MDSRTHRVLTALRAKNKPSLSVQLFPESDANSATIGGLLQKARIAGLTEYSRTREGRFWNLTPAGLAALDDGG